MVGEEEREVRWWEGKERGEVVGKEHLHPNSELMRWLLQSKPSMFIGAAAPPTSK